ncbi:MAG: hypothetical protein DMC57_00970 [Verrucomicrobia bacterium]|nr:MAG: hypothetical protein DMC57_00970 [Verrucomicrobiota bacterium]
MGQRPRHLTLFFQRRWCSRVISEREEGLSSRAQARDLAQAVLITQVTLGDPLRTGEVPRRLSRLGMMDGARLGDSIIAPPVWSFHYSNTPRILR